jgi:hypothetical protein
MTKLVITALTTKVEDAYLVRAAIADLLEGLLWARVDHWRSEVTETKKEPEHGTDGDV